MSDEPAVSFCHQILQFTEGNLYHLPCGYQNSGKKYFIYSVMKQNKSKG
jgi:hypothetical protein